jgi:hypothetical protein
MEKGDGMSFAEFSYPLLQGWDWWHMYAHHDVQLQVGGSDQYGNIVAGMDAIKHISQINPEALAGKNILDNTALSCTHGPDCTAPHDRQRREIRQKRWQCNLARCQHDLAL